VHKEFEGVKVLELNGCIQAFIWTKKPVRNMEDMKGLKIRSPGGHQTNYIKALGAEPIFMPLGEVYMAMETGTIDGIVTCSPLVLAFKLHEVAKHGVMCTFGCVTEGVVMNQKAWDKAPEDLKPIIMQVVGNPYETTGGLAQKSYTEMIDEIKSKGVELYQLPKDEEQRWFTKFQEETKKWAADLAAKGLASKETVALYEKIAEQYGAPCPAVPAEWHN
jgi:TRAP-type C4-dicarboxylate transport system substrate-binding protein